MIIQDRNQHVLYAVLHASMLRMQSACQSRGELVIN